MRRIAHDLLVFGLLSTIAPLAGCASLRGAAPATLDADANATPDAPPSSPADPTDRPPKPPKYHLDPGVTGYSHILGWVSQRYVYPGPLVERAVIESMSDMGMHSVKRGTRHKTITTLIGLLYDGRLIAVEIEPQGEHTVVRSRIDVYGDEPKSKMFHNRVSVRLATLPQAVFPPFDPRTLTDSTSHRGMDVEGYRGAPLR